MSFNNEHEKQLKKILNVNLNKHFSIDHPFEVLFQTIELDSSIDYQMYFSGVTRDINAVLTTDMVENSLVKM